MLNRANLFAAMQWWTYRFFASWCRIIEVIRRLKSVERPLLAWNNEEEYPYHSIFERDFWHWVSIFWCRCIPNDLNFLEDCKCRVLRRVSLNYLLSCTTLNFQSRFPYLIESRLVSFIAMQQLPVDLRPMSSHAQPEVSKWCSSTWSLAAWSIKRLLWAYRRAKPFCRN